jgi:hypothetical protein
MKVRLDSSSVRLRLPEAEVAEFARVGHVTTQTIFPGSRALNVRLETAAVAAVSASFDGDTILVGIPAGAAREWSESDQVAIHGELGVLTVLIEKDLRCQR